MPFTFAHPSIILVIRRLGPFRLLSVTAMLVGSMVPDLEAFLRLQATKTISHTFAGIFLFGLPAGLAVCFLWHGLLRPALTRQAPLYFRRRLYPYRHFNWPAYFRAHPIPVIVSLFFGIITHLLWDQYTHWNGIKPTPVIIAFGHEMADFIFWQYISSVAGLIVVVLFWFTLPAAHRAPGSSLNRPADPRYWLIVAGVATIVMCLCYINLQHAHHTTIEAWSYVIFVIFFSACALGVVVASVVDRYFRR